MSRILIRRTVVFAMLVLGISVSTALGQGSGAIGGTVIDASGAVLPGANVSLSKLRVRSAAVRKRSPTSGARTNFSASFPEPIR
jgi:hypothetical protein